jgi:murein DD-endopeptidase MepM/ murein hydrolase activator NlpD
MKYGMLVVLLLLHSAAAHAFELEVPVKCRVGKDCFIQNYVDQGKGKTHQDFRCRPLSYDGHKGTDFRIAVLPKEGKSVDVLASADGVVKGVRDGVPDALLGAKDKPDVTDVECGNGVLLEHEGGWHTQYCHLKQGSVKVQEGGNVKAGDVLGEIGLSGQTEFPHVHVQVRNPEGVYVDPFNAQPMESGCVPVKSQMWSDSALKNLNIVETGFLAAGVATKPVTKDEVLLGEHQSKTLPANAPAIVLWGLVFGLQKDDVLEMVLFDPKGKTFVENSTPMPAFKAQYFQFMGKKNSASMPWTTGTYEGMVSAKRGKETLFNETVRFEVK